MKPPHLAAKERDPLCALIIFAAGLLTYISGLGHDLFGFDAAEFVIGARTLGFVHAPGYPLYLLLLHMFLKLPGGPAYLASLFSALCMAASLPLIYLSARQIGISRLASLSGALMFAWGVNALAAALVVEVYALQTLGLSLYLWLALRFFYGKGSVLMVGAGLGLAAAAHPALSLLGLGAVLICLRRPQPVTHLAAAGLIAVLLALAPALYFVWRYPAAPTYNTFGFFDAAGAYYAVDVSGVRGLLWVLTGRQFSSQMSALPGWPAWAETGLIALRAYWASGLILAAYGLFHWWGHQRWLLLAWVASALPITWFFTGYGVLDKTWMFLPSLLLMALPLAEGLFRLLHGLNGPTRAAAAGALCLLPLMINYPRQELAAQPGQLAYLEQALEAVPAGAVVAGFWDRAALFHYAHLVEGRRPDLTIYNLSLFEPQSAARGWAQAAACEDRPLVIVADDALNYLDAAAAPLYDGGSAGWPLFIAEGACQ